MTSSNKSEFLWNARNAGFVAPERRAPEGEHELSSTVQEVEEVRVRVRRSVAPAAGGARYSAELALDGGQPHRAVIDAASREELERLLSVALPAFVASVRLRGEGNT